MNNEREQFISKEDEELRHIRENKIRKLKKEAGESGRNEQGTSSFN